MHPLAPALLSLAFLSASAVAEPALTPAYDACMERADGVTLAMLECIDAEIREQDRQLNQHYQNALQALRPDLQNQLRKAQRLWVQWREADCTLQGSLSGGSIDRINGAECYRQMTQHRAAALAALAQPEL